MDKGVMEAPLFDSRGTEKGTRRLPAEIFLQEINDSVVQQVVKAYLANRRQGTASTKNRAEVQGGGRKPWRQKGTGRARAGSIRSPLWRGGGMAFQRVPSEYRMKIPKRLKKQALYSVLSQKAREEAIKVFEYLEFSSPKTREMAELLSNIGVREQKVLILTEEVKRDVYLSSRNIPKVTVYPFKDVSVLDLLDADVLLIEDAVVETLESSEKAK
jgi:large subunit ribosomal protein L4